MTTNELKLKNATELERLAMELRMQVRDLRFKVATRQLTKIHEVKALKRQLAMVETVRRSLAS